MTAPYLPALPFFVVSRFGNRDSEHPTSRNLEPLASEFRCLKTKALRTRR